MEWTLIGQWLLLFLALAGEQLELLHLVRNDSLDPQLKHPPPQPPINHSRTEMLSRSVLSRQTRRAVCKQCSQLTGRRGLAAPASGSFQYETGTAAGVKLAARDVPGPTTHLALVSQAGTRFEARPGLTIGLSNFAFKVGLQASGSFRHSC